MADKLQLLLEAEKRGILPPDKKSLLDEARKRGLVPMQQQAVPVEQASRAPVPLTMGPRGPIQQHPVTGLQRQVGLAGRQAMEGFTYPVMQVGDATNALINEPLRWINSAAGTDIPLLGKPTEILPKRLTELGWPVEETPLEEKVGWASRFVAGIPAFPALKGASKAKGATIPTTEQIKTTAQRAYKESEEAGAILKPEAIQRLAANIQDDLAEQAYIPLNAPQVGGILTEIDRISKGNVTLKGLDALRKAVGDVARSSNAAESRLGRRMIDKIDDAITELQPSDIVQGDKGEAVSALLRARSSWNAARKSEMIDNALMSAEDRAAVVNSGGNLQNKIKQNIEKILNSPKKSRGFTKEELNAMRQLVRGSVTEDTLRTIGRLAPSSNSWLSTLLPALGYSAAGGPGVVMGTAVPIAGIAAKAGATAMTKAKHKALSELIRSGSMELPVGGRDRAINPLIQKLLQQSILQGANRGTGPNAVIPLLSGARSAASEQKNRRRQ